MAELGWIPAKAGALVAALVPESPRAQVWMCRCGCRRWIWSTPRKLDMAPTLHQAADEARRWMVQDG